jgi:hypothetical protein
VTGFDLSVVTGEIASLPWLHLIPSPKQSKASESQIKFARNPLPNHRFPANSITSACRFQIPNQRLGNSSRTTLSSGEKIDMPRLRSARRGFLVVLTRPRRYPHHFVILFFCEVRGPGSLFFWLAVGPLRATCHQHFSEQRHGASPAYRHCLPIPSVRHGPQFPHVPRSKLSEGQRVRVAHRQRIRLPSQPAL